MNVGYSSVRLGFLAYTLLAMACSESGTTELGAQTAPPPPTSVEADPGQSARPGDGIVFGPAPEIFPAGAEMAVLQGDPSVAGAEFTVRLRFPNGYILPAHFHPTDENVTVISGIFLVGLGDVFSKDALLPPLTAGGFITAPANVNHFATTRGLTVVQVHAIGPFQLTYVNPDDDPTK